MARLRVDMLGFGEIGGVGEMVYRTVRFPAYETWVKNGVMLIGPVMNVKKQPTKQNAYALTGQALLASLCNLYKQINEGTNGKTSYVDLIIQWCLNNSHPYQIDTLCDVLSDEHYDYVGFESFINQSAIFSVDQVLTDLQNLYHTQCFAHALKRLVAGDDSFARTLYHEGLLSDGFPFFEKYKCLSPASLRVGTDVQYTDMLDEMLADTEAVSTTGQKDTIKLAPASQRPFLQNPLDDMDYLQTMQLSMFPEFRMKLKENPRTHRVVFAADVQSVFDIGWYTLSRSVADDAPPEDEDINSMFREGSLLSCLCCGDFFVRRSSRQIYCGKPECLQARKRKNRRDCDMRKKSKNTKENRGQ